MNCMLRKSLQLHMLILVACVATFTSAQTALVFGANGAVGLEVLRAIVRNPFWQKVILVGRRFPPKVTELLPVEDSDADSLSSRPEVVKVKLSDLANVGENEELLQMNADACFIAMGLGKPYLTNLHYWHSVEIDMVASMARLCSQIHVQYVSVLSAVDAEQDPETFSEEKVNDLDAMPLGWGGMLVNYSRMKGLEEKAVVKESKNVPFVRLFQPSSIITAETRYGWVDWILFRLHKILDPILPEQYHSVKAGLLGMAMAEDAVRILSASNTHGHNEGDDVDDDALMAAGTTTLTYGDYLHIAQAEFKKREQEDGTREKSSVEL